MRETLNELTIYTLKGIYNKIQLQLENHHSGITMLDESDVMQLKIEQGALRHAVAALELDDARRN